MHEAQKLLSSPLTRMREQAHQRRQPYTRSVTKPVNAASSTSRMTFPIPAIVYNPHLIAPCCCVYMSIAFRRLTTLSSHVLRPTPSAYNFSTTSKLGLSASSISPAAMSSAKKIVDSAIKDNNVVVFSKTYCPVSLVVVR